MEILNKMMMPLLLKRINQKWSEVGIIAETRYLREVAIDRHPCRIPIAVLIHSVSNYW